MPDILVFAEQHEGVFAPGSLGLLCRGVAASPLRSP